MLRFFSWHSSCTVVLQKMMGKPSRNGFTNTNRAGYGSLAAAMLHLFSWHSSCTVVPQKTTSCSTIGEGGDTTISSPGRSPKQPLPGIRLHDLLHGRKLVPNSTHSTRGLVKYVPDRGYFRAVLSQNGDIFITSPPPPIVERVDGKTKQEWVYKHKQKILPLSLSVYLSRFSLA